MKRKLYNFEELKKLKEVLRENEEKISSPFVIEQPVMEDTVQAVMEDTVKFDDKIVSQNVKQTTELDSYDGSKMDEISSLIERRIQKHPQSIMEISAAAGNILGTQLEECSVLMNAIRSDIKSNDKKILELISENKKLELRIEESNNSLSLNSPMKIVIAGGITLSLVFLGYKFINNTTNNSLLYNSSEKLLKEEITENVTKYGFSLNEGFSITKIVKKSCSYE